jgi:hypothetical protein
MRKLILMTSVSLDGYIAGPNGELDWHLVDDEVHSDFNAHLRTSNSRRPGPSATASSSSATSAPTRRASQPPSQRLKRRPRVTNPSRRSSGS